MINNSNSMEFSDNNCLTDNDLYRYISGQEGTEKLSRLETHLATCSSCRQNLAELLKILDPKAEQDIGEISEPSKEELDRTLAIIKKVSRKEHATGNRISHRIQWAVAAAAAIGFVALSFLLFQHLYEMRKSESFFSQATKILEQNYPGASPGNLRLALPFNAASTNRGVTGREALRMAENLFYQALAFREGMVEARLGLACIYLNESKFDLARDEFQKVLDIQKEHIQALVGRGVAKYEQALHSSDPLQRNSLLLSALGDFNAVLQLDPHSIEARYDKIRVLFDSGMHKEALQEIDMYIARDPDSNWAEELRGLKIRIKATQISAVREEVYRAAHERNKAALWELASQVPYQMPTVIPSIIEQSLELEPSSLVPGNPNSEDLRWAAEIMEAAYSVSTGDHSLKTSLAFYIGLSPPQRALERALDNELQNIAKQYQNGEFTAVLQSSKHLERQYAELKDFWHLAGIHHLRGNSFYLGKADFDSTEAEFRKMLGIARRLKSPDITAQALSSLAMIYGMQRKFDDSLRYANSLKSLAETNKMESWLMYACMTLGNQFCRMGQFEQSVREYATALQLAYRLLDSTIIIATLERLGQAMDGLGHIQEAKAYYHQALLEQDRYFTRGAVIGPEARIRRFNLLSKQGDIALRIGDFASAETFFQKSLKSIPSGMIELEGRTRVGLAEVYVKTNRIREAEDMIGSALAISASGQYPDIEWQAKSIRGSLLERAGNRQEALISIQQSIEVLERMRQHITPKDLRYSFLANRFDPFQTMVSLLFDSARDKKKALEFVDRAKSLTLKENLKQDNLVSESTPDEKIPYSIVEYFFASDELLIFLTSQEKVTAVSRKISKGELSRQIQVYLESIRQNNSKVFVKMARLLYEELISPIEKSALIDSSEILVLLPDGPLHLLPFAGLQDQNGHFLIEKIPLAFAPSRSVFNHCLFSHRGNAVENRVVLIDGSSGLPSAREELVYLSRLYGRHASILTPEDLPAFSQAVVHPEILHFSGHADSVQGKPVLLLQTSPREIYLDCSAISTWRMPHVHLVNLAGCSTGIGPLSEGEAPWGLIPAFLNAGTPAIIASLMPVDDFSTKLLNFRFYDLLKKGAGKAKALQMAQLALLKSVRTNSDAKPQFWIPYILVGNPQ